MNCEIISKSAVGPTHARKKKPVRQESADWHFTSNRPSGRLFATVILRDKIPSLRKTRAYRCPHPVPYSRNVGIMARLQQGGFYYGFDFGCSGQAVVGRPIYVASIATQNPDGSIHMVAVRYWFDGARIYVATSARSRKARNLQSNPRASLMIDARDPAPSCGINIAGAAQILTGDSSQQWNARIHRKYLSEGALMDSRVGPVFASWDDVTIQITPTSVIAWDMRQADRQVFGSAFESNPTYLLPLER